MFSKTITNSSSFLMMPTSSQNLYFHLGMNADDDGFCEHFAIMRMTDSKPDDLKILQAKGHVKLFDDKVLVITDWKENNFVRSDRYTPSKYLSIYKEELKQLSDGIPDVIPVVGKRETQVRLELGKDNTIPVTPSEVTSDKKQEEIFSSEDWIQSLTDSPQIHINLIGGYFKKYAKHNFPTKQVALEEMKKNLKPAVYLTKNFTQPEITKTLRHCQDKFSDVHWNLSTVKKEITYVTANKG